MTYRPYAYALLIPLGGALVALVSACGGDNGAGAGGGGTTVASASSTGGSAPGKCMNAVKDASETDVDCGGACPRCANGKACKAAADCLSEACTGNVCADPSCTDKTKDGLETDVDCGGTCPAADPMCKGTCTPCKDGQSCKANTDCASGVCTAGLCQASSCKDSVKNGSETGVDCGGTCKPCPDGSGCTKAGDCQSAICANMVCGTNVDWAKGAGDGADQHLEGVAFDAQGDVVVVGSFQGALDLGGVVLANAGGQDIFVAKISPAGMTLWAKGFGDAADQTGAAVVVDPQKDTIYVTGQVHGTVDFGGGPLANAGDPLGDAYLAAFNANGTYSAAQRYAVALAQRGTALAMNANGVLLLGGVFDGTMDLGCGAIASAGSGDVFMARLDNAGACTYSKRFGDANAQELAGLAVDAVGNVTLVGRFQGGVNFGGATLSMPAATFGGFAAKLDPAGVHVFSTSFGNTMFDQSVQSVAVDPSGNLFLAGAFTGSLTAGAVTLTSAGKGDLFVVKVDPGGATVWGKSFGDGAEQAGQIRLAADSVGNVVAAGSFQGTVDFGGGALTSAGSDDLFVAKLDGAGNHLWSQRFGDAASQRTRTLAATGPTTVALGGDFAGEVNLGGTKLTSAGGDDAFAAHLTTP